ncbi:histone deacetylase family protein [Roseibacterium sp. SDUM158017]|uniref:histone deacetylase family protein n=1 Tax=Roseicyclus salinarum TaxID=3036773 RepID=UPI002415090D|nr:histone deacetylase family protein [Roseibacterium sp. SDUM158017]MDG4646860.1 histone deacetylase family protein [Roseibacterium sp. SDUM158017]
MTTLIIENAHGLDHDTPPGHPEQVARLKAVSEALSAPAFDTARRAAAGPALRADITQGHSEGYLDQIEDAIPASDRVALDADTYVSPGSWDAALRGVGGCIAAVDAVLDGHAKNAFVATRPPGHHAERDRAMGFCLLGNVAIAAKHALDRRGLSRVAVVDFDVHHGNGTQDILWDEPRALFVSSHQMPLYPGTGGPGERGATRNIRNVPLSPGSGGTEMRAVYEAQVFPFLRAFEPEMVLVSAGFDAHRDDPLANLNWTEEDFAWVTRGLCDLADELCGGRVVSTLEGGYDLSSLAASVAVHVTELMERHG